MLLIEHPQQGYMAQPASSACPACLRIVQRQDEQLSAAPRIQAAPALDEAIA